LFSGKYSDQWNRGGAFAEAARIGAEIARTTALPSNGKVAFVPAIAGAAVAPEAIAAAAALGTAATAATVKLAQDVYDRFFAEYNGSEEKEYKTKKKVKGKQKDDIPDRFKGEKPYKGEAGKETAKRVLEKYGEWNPNRTGPGTDFNKLKKYFDTHFD
ncbi:hypothetical protein, partial [Desulforamulus aeronauticus]